MVQLALQFAQLAQQDPNALDTFNALLQQHGIAITAGTSSPALSSVSTTAGPLPLQSPFAASAGAAAASSGAVLLLPSATARMASAVTNTHSRMPIIPISSEAENPTLVFAVPPDKASKAPQLLEQTHFLTWVPAITMFFQSYKVQSVVMNGPQLIVLPTQQSQLTAAEREQGSAGYELSPFLTEEQRAENNFSKRVRLEYDKSVFAYQALLLSVSRVPIALSVVTSVPAPNAFEAWRKLQELLRPHTEAQRMIVERQMSDLRQGEQENIASYATRAQSLVNQLAFLGTTLSDTQIRSAFLRGIRSVSRSRVDLLLFQTPPPSFEATVATARQFEEEDALQRLRGGRNSNYRGSYHNYNDASEAHNAMQPQHHDNQSKHSPSQQKNKTSDQRCHYCNNKGHFERDCRKKARDTSKSSRQQGSSRPLCSWCHKPGHTEEKCYTKQNGFPRAASSVAQNGSTQNSVIPQGHAAYYAMESSRSSRAGVQQSRNPLADSGASQHLFTSRGGPAQSGTVAMQTTPGTVLYAQRAGKVVLHTATGLALPLRNVLQHESVSRDLVSVYQLIRDQNAQGMWFTKDDAKLIAQDGTVITAATQQNGVYEFPLKEHLASSATSLHAASHSLSAYNSSTVDRNLATLRTIHARLNHLGATSLNRLILNGSLPELRGRKPIQPKDINCEACRLAKFTHQPHGRAVPAEFRATKPLERVDWDYCGPINTPSLGGHTGILVGLDRGTDFAWVFLVESRDEIPKIMRQWVQQMHTQFGRWPQRLHSDNAKEFKESELKALCNSIGTITSLSPPYDSQLNGGVERENRTLLEASRTDLIHASAPKPLWGEAVKAAVEVYNRTRTRADSPDDKRVALQRFLNSPHSPSLAHLRTWGCTAYVRKEDPHIKSKFDAVATKMVFVGYADVGAWRFMDPLTRDLSAIVVSKHAQFFEDDFTAMRTLAEQMQNTEDAEDEEDDVFFERTALQNEIELVKRISLETPAAPLQSKSVAASTPASVIVAAPSLPSTTHNPSSPAATSSSRYPTRSRRPPRYYGKVDPKDIGLGVRAEMLQQACSVQVLETPHIDIAVAAPAGCGSDPRSWRDSQQRPDAAEWRASVEKELRTWQSLDVFDVVDSTPAGATVIGSVAVFKTKTPKVIGQAGEKKFRLAAQGTQQRSGVDYGETYSSGVSLTSLRTLTAICAARGLRIGHLDVTGAYLHAKLDRTVYMRVPECFEPWLPKGRYLRLKKAVYGLHQSGRLWADLLISILFSMEFTQCSFGDPYLFVRRSRTGDLLYIAVYVDDMPTAASEKDSAEMAECIAELHKHFQIKVTEDINLMLGIRFHRDPQTGAYVLSQQEYVEKLLERCGFDHAKNSHTPEATFSNAASAYAADRSLPSTSNLNCPVPVSIANYRRLVGELTWLSVATRFDLAHAVNQLARKVSAPDEEALVAMRRVLRYLAGSRDVTLRYKASAAGAVVLTAWSDSDFAGDESNSRSTSGILLEINGAPVHWLSRQQPTVSRSSSEAEYIAAGDCARYLIWLRVLLAELGFAQPDPTLLRIDNETASDMLLDDGRQFPKRKHIRVIYHWVREAVKDGFFAPLWVPTAQQLADLFTKPLAAPTFLRLRNAICMQGANNSSNH